MKFLLTFPLIVMLVSSAYARTQGADITVSLPPLAGLTTMLLPQSAPACLLPAGSDPHHVRLSPGQIRQLRQSKLLIRSLADDGFWPSLNFAPTVTTLSTAHDSGHAWLNPQTVQQTLPKLAQALTHAFPNQKNSIDRHLQTATRTTREIWQQWRDFIDRSDLKRRGVMMQHPAWQGLFQTLGVPVRGVLESAKHGQEYGPKKLERALRTLKQYPDTLLIGDANHSNRALQWLQQRTSAPVITLDALGQCGEAWTSLMQRNLQTLQRAIQP